MEVDNDKRLGRGLSALLGSARPLDNQSNNLNVVNGNNEVKLIPTKNIIAGVYQPRETFDDKDLLELSHSIAENGIIQPIIVRKIDEKGTFEIIAGERRFKAAKMSGLETIPAIVKNINNVKALEFAIIENIQRADLTPIEEAKAYKKLLMEFDYTQEQVAKKIGRSRSHVANILRLMSLPEEVQLMLAQKKITFGHAKIIMNSDNITEIAHQIIDNNWTVRDLEFSLKNNLDANQPNHQKKAKKSLNKTLKKNSQLSDINLKLSELFSQAVVSSVYNYEKQQGRITIIFQDISQIEESIKKL